MLSLPFQWHVQSTFLSLKDIYILHILYLLRVGLELANDIAVKMASEILGCLNTGTVSKLWERIVPDHSVLSYPPSNVVRVVQLQEALHSNCSNT